MVVIDTSAAIAMIRREPEAEEFVRVIALSSGRSYLSAVSLVEAALVLGGVQYTELMDLLRRLEVIVAEFDAAMATLAIGAARRYGKGRGSKAQLNFGDCCVYATAKALRLPLLFKGKDFAHTDIVRATTQA